MTYRDDYETVWSFNTARFRVELATTDDYDLDLSWDEYGAARRDLEAGRWPGAFIARVQVVATDTGLILGADHVGGNIYESIEDFMKPGGYFQDMVSAAIREARETLAKLPTLRAA
jgi:hypothetical protein